MNKPLALLAYTGMNTPWGKAQYVTEIIPNQIVFVGTAGHGGVKLSRKLNAMIPADVRAKGGWYEEDCDWAIPFVVLRNLIAETPEAKNLDNAISTLKNWHPTLYERLFSVVLAEGESFKKDEASFAVRHANDLQGVSAVGDWHTNVPQGFVGVTACVGGRKNGMFAGTLRNFLVPQEEYQVGRFSFIVDPAKYQEVDSKVF